MRFLIVGMGAAGTAIGVRLGRDGNDVTFTDWPARVAQVPPGGPRLVTPRETLTLPEAQVREAPAEAGLFDYVIVAVRLHEVEAALGTLRSALAHDSAVVTLQPGHAAAARVASVLGDTAALPGVLDGTWSSSAAGVALQHGDDARLTVGEPSASSSWRADVLDAAMSSAGIDTRLSACIGSDLGQALVSELALGCVSARHACTPGAIAENAALRNDFASLTGEAEACLRDAGLAAAALPPAWLRQREGRRPTACQLDAAAGRRPELATIGRSLLAQSAAPRPVLEAYLAAIEACTHVDRAKLI